MAERFTKVGLAREYIEKFPEAGTKTLARLAIAENPQVWGNLDAARQSFRYARGARGNQLRRWAKGKHTRPLGKAGQGGFAAIPPGLSELGDFSPVALPSGCSYLVLSDIHVPYHDRDSFLRALEWGVSHGCQRVVINGDFVDNYAASRWQTDPRQRNYQREIETARTVLEAICQGMPGGGHVTLKLGNHDERLEAYLQVKAPELLGLSEFRLESLLRCEELGVQVVGDMRPIRLGHLSLLHGHEYKFSISNPVNPARGLFLRGHSHAICGHFHQSSQHSDRNLEQKVVSCWSTGCLCNLHPRYMPLNKWNHGFAVVRVDDRGAFRVNNYRIIDGEVYN